MAFQSTRSNSWPIVSVGDTKFRRPVCATRTSRALGTRFTTHIRVWLAGSSCACSTACRPSSTRTGSSCETMSTCETWLDANLLVLEDERSDFRVFNVGGGRATPVHTVAEILIAEFGSDSSVPTCPENSVSETRGTRYPTSAHCKLWAGPRRSRSRTVWGSTSHGCGSRGAQRGGSKRRNGSCAIRASFSAPTQSDS